MMLRTVLLSLILSVLPLSAAHADTVQSHDINMPTSIDQISGQQVWIPRSKMTWGATGVNNDVSAANPLPVSATFSGSITTGSPINPAGSITNNASVGSGSATTFTAPAHAVGFILENESTTVIPIRWAVGSTATSSVGNYYEAGRDTGFVPMSANISVIGVGGTAAVEVQWVLNQ